MDKHIYLSIIIVLLGAIATASLFVYYPLTIQITPQQPGVIFEAGSNAGGGDIGENTIGVALGDNKTSAEIIIHPTYQENYYKDILRITNNDDEEMKVYIMFTYRDINLPGESVVKLFIYKEDNTLVNELDITNPSLNSITLIGDISSGETWQVDIYVYIPEGKSIEGASYTAQAKLIYTPSSTETPPVTPSSGR
ncbi:MAG: hypothetical protein QXE81_06360 [Desulfurococcaceae archaeon]